MTAWWQAVCTNQAAQGTNHFMWQGSQIIQLQMRMMVFLVTYLHDENTRESKFLVVDTKSPTLEIVAVVKLPGRVPTGFHGLFVSESHLSKRISPSSFFSTSQ